MHRTILIAAMLAMFAPLSGIATEAIPPVTASASAVSAEKFTVGPMLVERHGSTGSPMILIPGLSSGPYVWDDLVREFGKEHVLYLVTLPGFHGQSAVGGDLVAGVDTWLGELIATRKLVKPILVGHSLGATFSFAYAENHAEQIGGVIAIDGLPVMPGTENLQLAQRPAMANGMRARMAGVTRDSFAAQQKSFMHSPFGVMDSANADRLAASSALSDPAAVTEYMAQVVALDLRSGLPKIRVPVLMIAPFHEADMIAAGMPMRAADKAAYYKGLLAGTPKLQVVTVSPARHFAMIDQPQQVREAIRAYLKAQ